MSQQADSGTAAAEPVDVVALRQSVDVGVTQSVLRREAEALGLRLTVTWVDSEDELAASSRRVSARGRPLVTLTTAECRPLTSLARGSCSTVRVDLSMSDQDRSPELLAHVRGRGLDGLAWGLRALVHRLRSPAVPFRYGSHPDQFGHLRLPEHRSGSVPVVVLLHGGFWRSKWEMDLMDSLAADLVQHGFASWNVEYRRPDRHGWEATSRDVEASIRYLARLEVPDLDLGRVALVGHSAGGQLAVRAAADLARSRGITPALVVSLAGVLDLDQTYERDLGDGAALTALGAGPDLDPEAYACSSPLGLLPVGVPTLVVTADSDSADLNDMSRRYAEAACAAGDQVIELTGAGDHFTLIDPASPVWAGVRSHLYPLHDNTSTGSTTSGESVRHAAR